MFTLFLASLLALPTPSAAPQPLPLKDSRFQYAVSTPTGTAARTLLVTPTHAKGTPTPQVIALTGLAAKQPAQHIVVRDVNFDGQPDLMLTSARGNVNSQYTYWLYDAATQRFVLNKALSNAIGGYKVTFDEAKKQIITASRFSCCEHQTRTYAFQKGALKLLATKTDKTPAATGN